MKNQSKSKIKSSDYLQQDSFGTIPDLARSDLVGFET